MSIPATASALLAELAASETQAEPAPPKPAASAEWHESTATAADFNPYYDAPVSSTPTSTPPPVHPAVARVRAQLAAERQARADAAWLERELTRGPIRECESGLPAPRRDYRGTFPVVIPRGWKGWR
jgi:hypothetical protein